MKRLSITILAVIVAAFTGSAAAQHSQGANSLFEGAMPQLALNDPAPVVPPQAYVDEKNPYYAFGFSAIITGGGQFYNEQYEKGILMFGLAVVGYSTSLRRGELFGDGLGTASGLVWIGAVVWSLVDAPMSANKINEERRRSARLHINPMVGRDLVGAQLSLRF